VATERLNRGLILESSEAAKEDGVGAISTGHF